MDWLGLAWIDLDWHDDDDDDADDDDDEVFRVSEFLSL